MKIIKGILIILVVLFVLVTVVGFLSPEKVHVERTQAINASPQIGHEQIILMLHEFAIPIKLAVGSKQQASKK